MKKWTVTIVREDGVKTVETHASKDHAIAYAEELAEMADAMELDVTITVEESEWAPPGHLVEWLSAEAERIRGEMGR